MLRADRDSVCDEHAVRRRSTGSPRAGTAPASRKRPGCAGCSLSEYLVLLLTVVYVLVMWPIVPEIATADTLLDILVAMMPLLIVAIGRPSS